MCTENFHMYKLDLEKVEKPEIKLPASIGSQKKEEKSRRTYTFASLTMLKPLTVWLTHTHTQKKKTVENSAKDGNTRPSYLSPEKQVCRSRSNSEKRTWNNNCLFNFYAEYIMQNARLDEVQA